MVGVIDSVFRDQLLDRRHKLEDALEIFSRNEELARLLQEVDSALGRIDRGVFGLCEACKDPVESDRLIADPLTRFCIDHLTPREQRALQEDLDLAVKIQSGLLPKKEFASGIWSASYHYEAAGAVSGDYCDLICDKDGELYFILGDVSGKGIAASMLMSQLHGMFRVLISLGLPLEQLVERASRLFCESTLPTQFATLVCGKASASGEIEICNAGHIPPLIINKGKVASVEATGLPIGLFCDEKFSIEKTSLAPGGSILLFTDGLTEAQNGYGAEYGVERISNTARNYRAASPKELIAACMEDLSSFTHIDQGKDDLTIMAIRRSEQRGNTE